MTQIMTLGERDMAYSYACADCEGMESCPGKVVAETEEEVWKLMELHAKIAHDEDVLAGSSGGIAGFLPASRSSIVSI